MLFDTPMPMTLDTAHICSHSLMSQVCLNIASACEAAALNQAQADYFQEIQWQIAGSFVE